MKAIKSISNETKSAIAAYMNLNKSFKGAYFFKPPSNAASRRAYENRNSLSYEGDGIKLNFSISCSAKNVYVTRFVEIDGIITNATSLKKFLN